MRVWASAYHVTRAIQVNKLLLLLLTFKKIVRQLFFLRNNLKSQRLSCAGWNIFLSAFFASFNSVWHNFMIAVVHNDGYAVIQVKHRRDINLKLSFYFRFVYNCFFPCITIFGISLESLIRLYDAWRTYD